LIWKIKHFNKKQETTVDLPEAVPRGLGRGCGRESAQTFSLGNTPQSDILILEDKKFPYMAHVILDDFFVFLISPDVQDIFYKKAMISFEKERLLFDLEKGRDDACIKGFVDFYKNIVTYEDIVFFHGQKTYFEDIDCVRKDALNSYSILNQEEIKEECQLIRIILKVVWRRFFVEESSFFERGTRRKFKVYIWNILNEIRGNGVLTKLLEDDTVTEVMVNGSQNIYVEVNGKLEKSPLCFKDNERLLSYIEKICSAVGRRIDESVPFCDARLFDGSRIHAIIAPLALNGPCLTIRKFSKKAITPNMLIDYGSVPSEIMDFLYTIVQAKKNILISGGTGSGKTTLLNCLSSFIPNHERIITIEDSQELQLQQEHVVKLESRNANAEQKGFVSIRDLVKNALRMRPDRIVVGECRGAEALDMLQAMNTGHDGSMTTVHANHPQDALRRLETLVLFANVDLPSRAIREQISAAIHYIIQQSRLPCGRRAMTSIYRMLPLCETTFSFKTESVYERLCD
jgi:Flp pilus assembly CpaF family ATPase